jgi:Tol biopolymer transport system component
MGWLDADGGGTRPLLAEPRRAQFPQAITPDGRTLVFERMELGTHRDLWILPLTGDRTPRPFLGTPADEHTARLSSDGRWLAYTSDESGRDEIYVRSFPAPGPALQVSDSGGRVPRWAPGGTTLHYWSRGRMMAVELTPDRPVRVLRREVLFDLADSGQDADGMEYDVLADGRFLTVLRGTEREEVAVEVNWLARVRSGAR